MTHTHDHHHTLRGRISQLRPVLPDDLEFVYTTSTCEQNGFRWRYRGLFPEPAAFSGEHNRGTLLQLLVVTLDRNERAGIVNLYAENFRDGWAYLGAVAAPEFQHTGVVVDGAATLMDYAFNLWPFHKIYLETIEYNLTEFEAGLRRVAVEEGRLRDHVFFGDRRWDVVTSAVYRDTWRDFRRNRPKPVDAQIAGDTSFDAFIQRITDDLEISDTSPDASLIGDLGIDSIHFIELVTIVCDLADAPDPDRLPRLDTLGDLHRWYLSLIGDDAQGDSLTGG